MRWNIFYTLRGPGGVTEAPNDGNPVGSENLKSLLANVAAGLPDLSQLGVEFVGFRAEVAPDKTSK